jgi:hypothetical protein
VTIRRPEKTRLGRLAALFAAVAMLAGATCPPESVRCATVACCPRDQATSPCGGCCPSPSTPDQDQAPDSGPTPCECRPLDSESPVPKVVGSHPDPAHGLPVAGPVAVLLPLPVHHAAPHAATLLDRPSDLLTTHLRC